MSTPVIRQSVVQVVEDIPVTEVVERLIYLVTIVEQPIAEARRIVVNEVAEHLIYGGIAVAQAEQLAAEAVTRVAPWSV